MSTNAAEHFLILSPSQINDKEHENVRLQTVGTSEEDKQFEASIRLHGIIEPLVVLPSKDGGKTYPLRAGFRRWQAALAAGLKQIPVVVNRGTESFAIALVENLQRKDMVWPEKARGIAELAASKKSQAEAGKVVGVTQAMVSRYVTARNLPGFDRVCERVRQGARIPTLDQFIAAGEYAKLQAESLTKQKAVALQKAGKPDEQTEVVKQRLDSLALKSVEAASEKGVDFEKKLDKLREELGTKKKGKKKVNNEPRFYQNAECMSKLYDAIAEKQAAGDYKGAEAKQVEGALKIIAWLMGTASEEALSFYPYGAGEIMVKRFKFPEEPSDEDTEEDEEEIADEVEA
jgi:ParB/RepB/Spo0J family partition protein